MEHFAIFNPTYYVMPSSTKILLEFFFSLRNMSSQVGGSLGLWLGLGVLQVVLGKMIIITVISN